MTGVYAADSSCKQRQCHVLLTAFSFASRKGFSNDNAQLACESMVTTRFGSGQSGKTIQGRKMVDWHSQATDDLFALDFFAIHFVLTGERTERLNPPQADQQR
jgi:hypothetical protein